MESLSDSSTLADLSFEDFLDQSPVKKLANSMYGNENDFLEETSTNLKDDTLNTPVAKQKLQTRSVDFIKSNQPTSTSDALIESLVETIMQTTPTSSVRVETTNEQKKTNALGTPTPPTTPKTVQTVTTTTAAPVTSTTTTGLTKLDKNSSTGIPILLNNKIALTKSSTPTQTIVKIATNPSTTLSTTLTTPTKATTVSSVTTIDGKTALKTVRGQIVYIQKGQSKNAILSGGNATTAFNLKSATAMASAATTKNLTSVKVTPVASTALSGSSNKLLTTTATTANIGGNKTVIQLIRSSDGKLVPLKTATTSGNSKLTLSPNIPAQLAGTKLLTTASGQVVLKTPLKQTTSLSANTTIADSVVTTAKPIKIQKIMTPSAIGSSATPPPSITTSTKTPVCQPKIAATTSSVCSSLSLPITTATTTTTLATGETSGTKTSAGGKIVVQGTQIVVPSSQLIKLSPKLGGTTTTAATAAVSGVNTNTTNSSTPISGALHAIHIPGKQGLQYVRVFTAPKKPINPSSTTASSIVTTTSTTASMPTMVATNAKLMNSVPPKFTVVRPSPTGKIILTKSPKSEGNPVLSPITAPKIKTIVTVPTIRNIAIPTDSSSTNPSPLAPSVSIIKGTTTTSVLTANACETASTTTKSNVEPSSGMLRPKPKISEINSEIQRMTSSSTPVEGKRVVSGPDGKRYLVMPRSILRTTPGATAQNRVVSGQNNQQIQKLNQQSQQQQHQQQRSAQQTKVYSVVKAGDTSTVSSASSPEGAMKSFIICKSAQGGSTMKAIQVNRQAQQLSQSQLREEEETRKLPTLKPGTTATTSTSTLKTQNSSNNKFIPMKIKQEPMDDDLNSLMFSDEALVRGGVRRKHCNCSKSQCLKLYCDCFANGEFCQDCTCKDCFNNLQYEDERQRAIKSCLERNPSAFKPKITSSSDQCDTRSHNKGCNCKRSGCLKNYCECFEAKIPCSSNCKCVGCRNVEDRPDLDMDPIDPKLLESIANASNATNTIARAVSSSNQASFACGLRRSYDKALIKKERKSESDVLDDNDHRGTNRKRSHLDDDFTGTAALFASPQLTEAVDEDGNVIAEKRNSNFITQEVIDATIQCMISQADECLKNNLPALQIEKMVLEELGRCLVEIIDFSIRNTDTSFSQN